MEDIELKHQRGECKLKINFRIKRGKNKICTPNNQTSEAENKGCSHRMQSVRKKGMETMKGQISNKEEGNRKPK